MRRSLIPACAPSALILASLASTLLLGACSKPADEAQTPQQAAAAALEAAQKIRPEPGKYRVTTKITSVSIPGLPPAAAEQAKQMFSETGHSSEFCLTAADAKMGFEEMIKRAAEGKCTYDRFSADGGKLDAAMTCDTGKGMTAKSEVTGTFSPTGSNMTMVSNANAPGMPGGGMRMEARVVTERIGACG